jgi:hypothetical protein
LGGSDTAFFYGKLKIMSEKQINLVKVKLSGAIQHNGCLHYSGEVIEMDVNDAKRLAGMKIADLVDNMPNSEAQADDADAKKTGKK